MSKPQKVKMGKRVRHELTTGDGDQMKINEIKYGLSGVFVEGKITEKSEPRTVNTVMDSVLLLM